MNAPNKMVLFTRFPISGKTKTRLIPHLGSEGAAQLQREMTEHIIAQSHQVETELEIRYCDGSENDMKHWLGDNLNFVHQGEGHLGNRMSRAVDDHFATNSGKLVIIGADCPSITPALLNHAFQLLDKSETVLGATLDGGYYLIGMNSPHPEFFSGIDWGTKSVFEQTLALAEPKTAALLEPLSDVDEPGDIPPLISVIIPTLNEAPSLGKTLEHVRVAFRAEAIVVDGGSTDATQAVAEQTGAIWASTIKGRGAQLNHGASIANGSILLFLHADTRLPNGWEWMVRRALEDQETLAGAFHFKTDLTFPGHKLLEYLTNFRSIYLKLPYGDQGLFLKQSTFQRLEGFPEIPIMEDYAFIQKLRSIGRVITLPEAAIASARRWNDHGLLNVTCINALMVIGYRVGIAPGKLAQFYRSEKS